MAHAGPAVFVVVWSIPLPHLQAARLFARGGASFAPLASFTTYFGGAGQFLVLDHARLRGAMLSTHEGQATRTLDLSLSGATGVVPSFQ